LPRILVVGGGRSSHLAPARRRGLRIAALVAAPTPSIRRRASEILVVDPSRSDEAVERTLEFARRHPIDACLTRFESYVELAAAIARALGLRGPSPTAARACRDKLAMREAFARDGVPQPRFCAVHSAGDLERAALDLGFPFLVKPVSGTHSRHLAAVRSRADLDGLFARLDAGARSESRLLFRSDGDPRFIAEELLEGPQVTCSSVVVGREVRHVALADVVTARDRGIDAFYLYARTTPSRVGSDLAHDICGLVDDATAALDLEDTAIHPEILVTREGPKMIELAARVGGFRAAMTRAAFGIDLDDAAVAIACGMAPDLAPRHARAATAIELWPSARGTVTSHYDLDLLRARPGVHALRIRTPIGTHYEPPPTGETPAVTFTAEGADPASAEALADEVCRTLDLRIAPAPE
jgi:biotin carboxylase